MGADLERADDALSRLLALLRHVELPDHTVGERDLQMRQQYTLIELDGRDLSSGHASKNLLADLHHLFAAGDHLVVDAGPHGYENGGHAHADALSMTFTVRGVPLLIDPGTGSYTADPAARDHFRSSQLHNTVVVDGRSQSQFADVKRRND